MLSVLPPRLKESPERFDDGFVASAVAVVSAALASSADAREVRFWLFGMRLDWPRVRGYVEALRLKIRGCGARQMSYVLRCNKWLGDVRSISSIGIEP